MTASESVPVLAAPVYRSVRALPPLSADCNGLLYAVAAGNVGKSPFSGRNRPRASPHSPSASK